MLKVSGQLQRGLQLSFGRLLKKMISFLDWCPCVESIRSTSGGFAAGIRSPSQKMTSFLDLRPCVESARSTSGGFAADIRSPCQKMISLLD